jgi:hypothetical protein
MGRQRGAGAQRGTARARPDEGAMEGLGNVRSVRQPFPLMVEGFSKTKGKGQSTPMITDEIDEIGDGEGDGEPGGRFG